MILGHSHPDVLDAVRAQLQHGLSYGAPTAMETEMADLVCSIVPSMEMVRMVSSGTEATMSAIRLARGFTGRDNILKFEGCYHGHSDSLLVKAGSGALTQGVPSSGGVPADFAKHTLTTTFNDIDAVEQLLAEVGDTVACIIVEPVAGNMNCVPPAPGFLQGLRQKVGMVFQQFNLFPHLTVDVDTTRRRVTLVEGEMALTVPGAGALTVMPMCRSRSR